MESLFAVKVSYLIPLLPLLGAVVAGFGGARWLKQKSHWPIWIGVGLSAVLSFSILFGMVRRWEPRKSQDFGRIEAPSALPNSPSERMHQAFDLSANAHWFNWIQAGDFRADAGAFIDPLTAVMLCVVTGIGFLITVFAAGYMKGEAGYFRFFAYLGLFIFAMTILVMGNNFVMLYLGWEGVGLCSYLLIGYYYERPSAREAAKKAFLVNRIGDFGFGLGMMLIFVIFGSVSYFGDLSVWGDGVLERALHGDPFLATLPQWKLNAMQWIPFLLMMGAFGKSAQFPLYVWLPDAMEGPTPVSALIHAATMVTAGVYMIVRCGTLFFPYASASLTIAAIGTFTAIFAATIALRQFDLKKVFAYSTISQLGFMFAAVGLLAPVAGIFHLVTHAFFKALLFLSSGVVMHAMLGHLDMRKMSGLKTVLPKTRLLMLIGCLSLAGAPFLGSGFFSKDEILVSAWYYNWFLALILLVTAFLTAYYTFRLYFRVFEGPLVMPTKAAEGQAHASHDEHEQAPVDEHLKSQAHSAAEHSHEPAIMIWPLIILAIGAFFAGYLNWPERERNLGGFLSNSPSLVWGYEAAQGRYRARTLAAAFGMEEVPDEKFRTELHSLHIGMMMASIVAAGLGVYLAYLLHLKYRDKGDELAVRYPAITRALEGKYWVDEVYQQGIVEPLRWVGRTFYLVDRYVVDGVVWLIGFGPQLFGFTLKLTTQRGSLQGYAAAMLLAVVLILLVLFL
jgi:NADH-quinone oxidoreductase subunit L